MANENGAAAGESPAAAKESAPAETRQSPMERLKAKLDAELAEYSKEMLTKSKREILEFAFQAASVSDAYSALTEEDGLTNAQIEALLDADSPLREVAEALRDSFNVSMLMLDAGTLLEGAHIHVPSESEGRGYVAAVSDGDGYIPDAVHIERDDSLNIYPNDHAAARAAEADGVKLIYGLPYIPDKMYLDTPENRAIAERASEEARLAMPAGAELTRRLYEELDDGYEMYRDTVLAFDKERLFRDAGKIAESREAYEYFRREHDFSVGQAEFLLKFHNPMEVIWGRWHAPAPEAVFENPEKAFRDFTTVDGEPAKTAGSTKEPRSFREWKARWQEENKNRPAQPKKEPGRSGNEPGL
jgi:hypothetical protein